VEKGGGVYVTVSDRETPIDRDIYRPAYKAAVAVLPKVRDEELILEAARLQKTPRRMNFCVLG